MRLIDKYLTEYGSSHQNSTNKLIHWVCVPAIMFSLLGLIWSIPSGVLNNLVPSSYQPYANWATLLILFAILYYIRLSIPMAIGMVLISGLMLWGNYQISQNVETPHWIVSLIIFAVAWIGQFYGHKVEGKKPSFLKDVQFLLIGPAWLLHFIFKKVGISY